MTYSEAIQFLYGLRLFGAKFGLENTRQLAALAGQPHQALRFIHVAGTNGKGSTCAMLESIYRAAGLKVGLFTSPHLVSFRERIQINREWISEADVVRRVEQAQHWAGQFPEPSRPTFFEVVTVMALGHFAEQKCDLVIWETGMGGRLDATNIVTPLASVITQIDFDHQKWLGHTLAEIAAEKAGIIKPGIPILTAEQKPDAMRVIAETAQKQKAPLTRVGPLESKRPPLDKVELPLLGDHQKLNAALAVATARALTEKIHVEEEAVRHGLQQVQWPGRLQIFRPGLGRTVVLDGAHNPSGAAALRAGLQKLYPSAQPTIVLGMMADKDWSAICQILAPLAGRICVSAFHSPRAAQAQLLAEHCQRINPYAEVRAFGSVEEAMKQTAHDPLVVVTGSLHFLGEVMEFLKLVPAPPQNERGLNDWLTDSPAGPAAQGRASR